MTEKLRVEDIVLDSYVRKYTREAFGKFEPYEKCTCKSGKDFKFCCYPSRENSKAWKMASGIIKELLTKKRLHDKIKRFEGGTA